jgi:hypothetical protein
MVAHCPPILAERGERVGATNRRQQNSVGLLKYIFHERCLGFTGSAGLAVILDKDAALWTDSRFFSQVVITRFLPPVSFTSKTLILSFNLMLVYVIT